MNNDWIVCLSGNEADLAELAKSFNKPALRIAKQPDMGLFGLQSDTFLISDSEDVVRAKATLLLDAISGAARLAFALLSPLSISGVARRKESGALHMSLKFAETISVRSTVSLEIRHADGSIETVNPADEVPDIVNRSVKHTVVRDVLKLLAKSDNDWVNLYRIFEVVADDMGGIDAIATAGWASKSALRNFKHTANSPGAIGHDARHGVDTGQPPAKAMQNAEAKALVHDLVKKWVRTKT